MTGTRSVHFSFYFVLLASALTFAAPTVTKIEPPNWWTGYVSPVMVLLYGEDLALGPITVDYPGVSIQKTEVQADGKHAFVWLTISPETKPGTVIIKVGTTRAQLSLSARQSQQGRFQGITRDDVIYLIMPDRFADGDPSNDMPPGAAPGTYDRTAPKTYHGGDLKGIKDHLAYCKDLGVTTLWLNPLYDNDNSTSDYHGYGAVDLYKVEDHFGTMADFQALVAAAHQQGIKILLDMVPNHVGPKHPWAASQPAPGWLHGTTENHVNSDYDYVPITDPHAVEANYRSALEGWFANVLPDLAQENPLVAQYLTQNALWWTESSGLDGFRIDTFPYVPREFWNYYLKTLRDIYPKFFAVGEVFNTDPTITSYWAGGHRGFDGIDTLLTTPFDFPMQNAIHRVINRGDSAKSLVGVLRQDHLFPQPELLVTFIGNHDMPRFMTEAAGSAPKLKAAFSLLGTLRGIPQIYYGDEIGMTGANDPDDRHDFPGGFPGDKQNAFAAAGRTPDQQDIYQHLQSVLKIRREHPALRQGELKHVAIADDYYVFTRELATEDSKEGERLLIVFYKGATTTNLNIDLTGTSIADAKSVKQIFGGGSARLNMPVVHLQVEPMSVAMYQVR